MWKECKVCSNYLVSNHGDVKNKHTGRILKQKLDRNNCLMVNLSFGARGRQKYFMVHRLVAEAFIPNPLNLPCVRHIDGVTINNESTNLEWATGKIPGQAHGEYSFNAKLTNEQAEWCRTVYIPRNKDFGAAALAKLFGVSPSTISYILNRRTYK